MGLHQQHDLREARRDVGPSDFELPDRTGASGVYADGVRPVRAYAVAHSGASRLKAVRNDRIRQQQIDVCGGDVGITKRAEGGVRLRFDGGGRGIGDVAMRRAEERIGHFRRKMPLHQRLSDRIFGGGDVVEGAISLRVPPPHEALRPCVIRAYGVR